MLLFDLPNNRPRPNVCVMSMKNSKWHNERFAVLKTNATCVVVFSRRRRRSRSSRSLLKRWNRIVPSPSGLEWGPETRSGIIFSIICTYSNKFLSWVLWFCDISVSAVAFVNRSMLFRCWLFSFSVSYHSLISHQ